LHDVEACGVREGRKGEVYIKKQTACDLRWYVLTGKVNEVCKEGKMLFSCKEEGKEAK
jgi:hypothetical protein